MKRSRIGMLLILLALVIFAVIIYQLNIVQYFFVGPIFFFIEIAVQAIHSLPQMGCLLCLVVIGSFIAIFGLIEFFEPTTWRLRKKKCSLENRSRYSFWLIRCREMSSSAFFLDDMSVELRQFLLNVLSYQEHRDTSDIEQMIIQGTFSVPPTVREFIIKQSMGDLQKITAKDNVFLRLWKCVFMFKRSSNFDSLIDQRLGCIINYLEKRLEAYRD
jgi:hypothetical protein